MGDRPEVGRDHLGPGTERAEVASRLKEAAERAVGGHGSSWLLMGPSGIGKSFVLDAWAQELERAGYAVVRGRFQGGSEDHLATIRMALVELRSLGGASASAGGTPRAATPLPSAPPLLILDFVRELIRATARGPVALLFDDAQRAGPESIAAFQMFSRAVGGLQALLVAALADRALGEGPEGDPLWQRTLDLLGEEGTLHPLPLRGLGSEATRALIARAASASLAGVEGEEILSGLLARTEGNPLFLLELVALLLQEKVLVVQDGRLRFGTARVSDPSPSVGGGWGPFPLPPTLRRLVLARLDHVLPADLQLLRAAALLGSPFELAALSAVLARTGRDLEATCQRLAERGLLRHVGGEPGEGWNFSHDLVWEVVLRDAGADDLRPLARDLARWWSLHRTSEVETTARLYHDAQEPVEGLPWVREAVDRALRSGATVAAERYFQWYFDLLASFPVRPEEKQRETLALVDRLLVRRLRRETLVVLKELERAYPAEEMRWEVLWREVHVLVSFDLPQAERRLAELERELARSARPATKLARAQLAFVRCEVLGSRLAWREALAAGEEALGLWEGTGSLWEKGRTLYELCWGHLMQGDLASCRLYLDRLRQHTERSDLPSLKATERVMEGTLSLMEGNLRSARDAYASAAVRLLELGAMEGYGVAKNNLAEVLLHLGDLSGAREALHESELIGARFGHPRVLRGCSLKWAWVHAQEGQWNEVLRALEEPLEEMRRGESSEEVGAARLLHAWALGELGSPVDGLHEVEEVRRDAEQLQPHLRPTLPRVEGRLLELAGRPGAREAFERSLADSRKYAGPEDQAAALRALARWERAHGATTEAARAEEEARSLLGSDSPSARPEVPGPPPLR